MLPDTDRLAFREILPADASFAFELNSDPEVIRFTGDEAFTDIAAARKFLEEYDQYEKFGYGRWMVVLKSNDEPLGWCGLKNQEEELGIIDLGYRFFRKHWGKGYATEAARACLDWGFKEKGMKIITARVAIGNSASEHVLEKLGFQFLRNEECHHHPAKWFTINASDWLKQDI